MDGSTLTYRSEVGHSLHQIPTKPIGTVIICRREQADKVEVQGAINSVLHSQYESSYGSFRYPLTEASKVIENVFWVFEAALVGVKVKLCCVHSPRALLDTMTALAYTSPVLLDCREAVNVPL